MCHNEMDGVWRDGLLIKNSQCRVLQGPQVQCLSILSVGMTGVQQLDREVCGFLVWQHQRTPMVIWEELVTFKDCV